MGVTRRKILEHWTETHRRVGDEVKVVTCCCAAPGASRKGCAIVAGNKTPCRCFCHSEETEEMARAKTIAREEKAGKFCRWVVSIRRVTGKREDVSVKLWHARNADESRAHFESHHPHLTVESLRPMTLVESAKMDWRKEGIEI